MKHFFQELKRRNVYRVAIAYAVVAWLVIQVASILLPTFEAPSWVMKVLTLVLIIGFPIALVLAWAFEVSPSGVVRTGSSAEPNTGKTKPILNKVIIGMLIILIIGQFYYNKKENSKVNDLSIAVLPLTNLNQKDENLEYFSDGVTVEIISELSKISSFVATAFTTTAIYKGSKKPHNVIASELEADYLVAGTSRIFSGGDSVKLAIDLIDPQSQKTIWNASFTEEMNDAPAIQMTIARQIADNLNIRLTPEEKRALETVSTTSGEAFNLFLNAKAEFFNLTSQSLIHSRELLNKALQLDPDYAQAHTFLAWNNILESSNWWSSTNSYEEIIEMSLPHIKKSIALDPQSSDVYLVRGNFNLYYNGLMRDAKRDVEYAIKLNSWPKVPTIYCMCTVVSTYASLGDLEKAKEVADLARKVDPGNVFIYWDRASIHLMEGEMEKAQALYEEAARVLDRPFFKFFLGWSYYHDQQYGKALEQFKLAYQIDGAPLFMNTAYLSNVYYQLGESEKSRQYHDVLKEKSAAGIHQVDMALAMVAAAQSDKETTLTLLEKSQNKKDVGFAYMVNVDPIFKPLYEDPRFIEMRKKMQYFE